MAGVGRAICALQAIRMPTTQCRRKTIQSVLPVLPGFSGRYGPQIPRTRTEMQAPSPVERFAPAPPFTAHRVEPAAQVAIDRTATHHLRRVRRAGRRHIALANRGHFCPPRVSRSVDDERTGMPAVRRGRPPFRLERVPGASRALRRLRPPSARQRDRRQSRHGSRASPVSAQHLSNAKSLHP